MPSVSYIMALLAIFCLTASCADETGVVSVSIKNTTFLGNNITNYQQEFVEFDYDAIEWNGEAANWEDEWSFEEDGVGEFQLTNQDGDVVVIRPHDQNDQDEDLTGILGTVVASPAGGLTTIASTVGNSISAAHDQLQNRNAAPVNVEVPEAIENVPESLVVVQSAENLSPKAENNELSAQNSTENVIVVVGIPNNNTEVEGQSATESAVEVEETEPEVTVILVESTANYNKFQYNSSADSSIQVVGNDVAADNVNEAAEESLIVVAEDENLGESTNDVEVEVENDSNNAEGTTETTITTYQNYSNGTEVVKTIVQDGEQQ